MENYVGKRLDGRYEIMEVIGVGGMAVVYKAFDNIDHRIVAVKILKSEYLANEEFKRRFRNESKAVAVLSHPNIVKVFDVSFGDAIQYIVMEYVEGITLKNYITQQGVVDQREALYFITQILRALKHAHDKGIVHRDIKPQNILLISDGTIKVTDFGIARISENATRTMTDGAIGSVHYISPEQAKGSITDSRTDLYAAGVILYEMLTGKLPFQSDNAVSVALMQLQNDPVRPREINSSIPEGLEEIIIHAMQKLPSERYQSANEMLTDITSYKSNPAIIFGYSFNEAPAVIADEPAFKPVNETVHVEPKAIEPVDDNEYDDEFEFEDKNKTKTIAILSSVLAALVVFAVALIVMFKPASDKIDVPNLVGLNFYNEVMSAKEYSYLNFEPIIDYDSDKESGIIIRQEPSSGKVSADTVIKVYISGSDATVEVPDVYGYEATSASDVLKRKGFDVVIVSEYSNEEIGTVIRTSPARNKMVAKGSEITIYVATDEETEPVEVPNLVGLTIDQAKEKLESIGLRLDSSRTEYRPSAEPVGRIIGHEFIGEKVTPGTSVAVYVSTGKLPEETTDEESTDEEESSDDDTTEDTTKPSTTKPTTEPVTEPSTTEPTSASTTESTTKPTESPTQSTTKEPDTDAFEPTLEVPSDDEEYDEAYGY
ncbi:MAG: Stk1 family PASTA domain-containing Ser/Thr kinase [Clostridia bacterium]|nr:Stk1 family PASTA domain-containing Ser/Thr kinase [Clostridia bacterium]